MTISIDQSIEQEQKNTAAATTTTIRQSKYKINPVILHRWSPRSMTGEELDEETIMSLFEAARWAPSYIIINHGDSHILKETHCSGTNFSIC